MFKKYAVLYKVNQAGNLANFRGEVLANCLDNAFEIASPMKGEMFIRVGMFDELHGSLVRTDTIMHIQVSAYAETVNG